MKTSIYKGAAVAALLVVFLGTWGVVSDTRKSQKLPAVANLVKGNTEFSLDLYHELAKRPGNIVFSPFSISSALSMVYAGAHGKTEAEIACALHFNLSQTELHQTWRDLNHQLDAAQTSSAKLLSGNILYCNRQEPLRTDFLELTRESYKALLSQVDFEQDADKARHEINEWVAKQTNRKIVDLIGDGQFGAQTVLVLCNAVYFKARWKDPFSTEATQDSPFYVSPNKTISVPMMMQRAKVRILSVNREPVALLEMPYAGEEFSMVVLLPSKMSEFGREAVGLDTLSPALTSKNLQRWLVELDQTSPEEAFVILPKFKMRSKVDLGSHLKALGIQTAFGPQADFSGINGARDLFISKAAHEAVIEVDEQGTEAAAATALVLTRGSRTQYFRADHPFLYLIRHKPSGLILFIGRVADPSIE